MNSMRILAWETEEGSWEWTLEKIGSVDRIQQLVLLKYIEERLREEIEQEMDLTAEQLKNLLNGEG